jgi:hypothetical protein
VIPALSNAALHERRRLQQQVEHPHHVEKSKAFRAEAVLKAK